MIPPAKALLGDWFRLFESRDVFLESSGIFTVTVLLAVELLPDTADQPEREIDDDGALDVQDPGVKVGEVCRRWSFGLGTGRGFTYLSAGSMVLFSEPVELTLVFLDRPLLSAYGICRTLTS